MHTYEHFPDENFHTSLPDQEDLLKSNLIIDNSKTIMFSWLPTDGWPIKYVSDNISQFGYSVDEFISGKLKYADIIYHKDLQRVTKEVHEYTKDNKSHFSQVYRVLNSDKEIRWVEDHTIVEKDHNGSIINYLGIVVDITDKVLLQRNLEQYKDKFETITDNFQIGVFIYRKNLIYANQTISDYLGYSFEELYNTNVWNFIHESDRKKVKEIVLKRSSGKLLEKENHDFKVVTKSGEIKTVRTYVQTIKYNGEYAGIGTVIDITDIEQTKEKLTLLSHAIEQTDDMVRITDRDGKIIFVNDSIIQHSGYTQQEILGQTPRIFKSDKHDHKFYRKMWSNILSGETFKATFINKKKNGDIYYEQETITPIDNNNGTQYFVATGKDISERVKMEHDLYEKATIDSLTGIINRQRFNELLQIELERYKRYRYDFAIIMLDIDYFKSVNDTYGHQIGDNTLKSISEVISYSIRKSDIFARWGGEEFIIIAPNLNKESAIKFSEKIKSNISSTTFEHVGKLTVSMGITFPKQDDTKEELFKRVDNAMYLSKESGRNKVSFL